MFFGQRYISTSGCLLLKMYYASENLATNASFSCPNFKQKWYSSLSGILKNFMLCYCVEFINALLSQKSGSTLVIKEIIPCRVLQSALGSFYIKDTLSDIMIGSSY